MSVELTEKCVPQFVLDDSKRNQLVEDDWGGDRPDDATPYHRRKSAGIWVALATLTVALAVVAGYGYAVLSAQDTQLSQIPGMASSLPAINQHLSLFERRLSDWGNNQQALASRVGTMDAQWNLALAAAKQQTAGLVAETESRLNRQSVQQTRAISEQLAQIESSQRAYQARLTEAEGELAEARRQVVALRQNYSQEIAALHEQQAEARNEIDALNSALATRQVGFEIQRNREQEIVPGVVLQLTGTNVHYQRFDGWVKQSESGEKLWIHGQGIQQPFVFYPSQQDEAYELVVTGVTAKSVTGYVLVPATNGAVNQARVNKGDSPTPVTLLPTDQSSITGP